MSDNCKGIMGKLFGHNFKPVVTKSKSSLEIESVKGSLSGVSDLCDKYRDETFKCIYCTRCGYILEQKA